MSSAYATEDAEIQLRSGICTRKECASRRCVIQSTTDNQEEVQTAFERDLETVCVTDHLPITDLVLNELKEHMEKGLNTTDTLGNSQNGEAAHKGKGAA